jgi:hypothetical protein
VTAVDERAALAFYEFIDARLDEELRTKYPTTNSTPAVEEYREKYRAAKKEHDALVGALHRGDQDQAADLLWGLRNQAASWKTHPDYPEPISDGTMPCPVRAGDRIPLREADPQRLRRGRGARQRPLVAVPARGRAGGPRRALRPLSGQPTPWHLPEHCTPECWKWSDR